MMDKKEQAHLQAKLFEEMLRESGAELKSGDLILDLGCGEGWMTYQWRKKGLKAFGADIVNDYSSVQQLCQEEGIVKEDEEVFRLIDMKNYKVPFEDETFNVVVSDQVFEHVQNYPEVLAEIKRVLKAGGSSLHVFPSRYRPLEAHLFVPLAGVLQGRAYLAFWAFSGIRNSFQQGLSWREVSSLNEKYLKNCTTYYTKRQIRNLVVAEFGNVSFIESIFIKHHFGRVHRYLYPLSRRFAFVSLLFCTLHSRIALFKKIEHANDL